MRLRPLAALAAAALLLTGCSTGADAPSSVDGDAPAEQSGAFPATIDTKFGAVTIDEKPERIVALGWGDAETALSLGVQPVGASDWIAFGGEGVGPWAEGQYDEAPTIIDTLEPSYEQIAALEPDLILDVKSSGDEERYERLSEIATTIGVPEGGDSYLATGAQQMEMIAAAVGEPEKGEEIIADLDARIQEVADEHPEWEGLTVSSATRTSEGWGAYIEGTERVDLLTRFGFVQNPAIADMETDALGFSVALSNEQLDTLDADLIVAFPIYIETTEITDDPLWNAIPAVEDGRAIVIDGDLSSAYSLSTVGAQEYAIDNLVPLIEEALAD